MKFNKFILGGVLILAAVVYLIFSSTRASAEYFMTVDELQQMEQPQSARACGFPARSLAIPSSTTRRP